MELSNILEARASAILTIDLEAVRKNYQILKRALNGVEVAAVVKANGYGLGADKVGPTLVKAGCKKFFVANIEEGRWAITKDYRHLPRIRPNPCSGQPTRDLSLGRVH
jgi:hypothetical protein